MSDPDTSSSRSVGPLASGGRFKVKAAASVAMPNPQPGQMEQRMEQVAWIVECPKYHPGEYFALCECGCGRHHWTRDVHKAAKFPSKEIAETTRGKDVYCIAVEHIFGLPLTRPTPDGEIGELGRGAMNCPICGLDTPHSHTETEIKHRPDQLAHRLARLATELRVGFYSAAHRTYETDYSRAAERALGIDLRQAATALETQAADIARLREALEPFAKIYDKVETAGIMAAVDLQYGCVVAIGALRRAAALAARTDVR